MYNFLAMEPVLTSMNFHIEQESILPVGCILLLTCHMCFSSQPPDASTAGERGPLVNKFKQVSSFGHQMPLVTAEPCTKVVGVRGGPHVW